MVQETSSNQNCNKSKTKYKSRLYQVACALEDEIRSSSRTQLQGCDADKTVVLNALQETDMFVFFKRCWNIIANSVVFDS